MRPTSLNHRARSSLHVLICLLLIIIGAVGSSLAQRDGGKVNVQGLMIPGKDGALVSADLFRPDTATEKNKAPMVIVSPGFQRTKETQISYSMELARRGYVTLVVDPYNQGESTSQPPTNDDPSIKPAIDYVSRTTTLNYVDKSRIGITGHSAGGSQVRRMAAEYGAKESKALKKAKSPNSPGGTTITKEEREKAEALNPIRSVFISGWLQKLDAKKFKKVHSNVGIGYAFYDEGGYRNKNGNGDLRTAPEALAVINSGLSASQHVDHVVIGKGYGSTSDRTYRVAYNDRTIHPFQPLTPSAIGSMIQFFDDTLGAPHAMSTTNQTWWLKELCNGLSLVAALVMLVPLTKLLLTIPWFSPARTEVCPAPAKPRGRGAVMFWTIFVISAAVACVTFIPLSAASQHVFSAAANKQNGWFFPGRMVNAVVLWSLVNGLFGLILLWISHSMSKHRGADEPRNWGGSDDLGPDRTHLGPGTARHHHLLHDPGHRVRVLPRRLPSVRRGCSSTDETLVPHRPDICARTVPVLLLELVARQRLDAVQQPTSLGQLAHHRLGQLHRSGCDLRHPVRHLLQHRNRVLDDELALRQHAAVAAAHDDRAAVVQPRVLPRHRTGLAGSDRHDDGFRPHGTGWIGGVHPDVLR